VRGNGGVTRRVEQELHQLDEVPVYVGLAGEGHAGGFEVGAFAKPHANGAAAEPLDIVPAAIEQAWITTPTAR